jgi:N-acetylmuramoyl-L-alanine amidase
MICRRRAATVLCALLFWYGAGGSAWAEAGSLAKPEPCNRGQFRVILDVGHTAEVPGAISARGVGEYHFNLWLAQEIKQRLLDAGFTSTALLVTSGPAKPSLIKRVALANRSPAHLFLSIHHDSVPTWFIETWEYEGKASRFSDRFKGHSIFISNENSEVKASLLFGKFLGQQLKARGLQYASHYTEPFMRTRQRELVDTDAGVYRFDQLVVLRKTRMPAVLLEAGSIINRDEELLVASPERHSLISDAVTKAVEQFCALQLPRDPNQFRPRRPGKPEAVSAANPRR